MRAVQRGGCQAFSERIMYLANRGIRAANVPIVPGVPPPDELITAKRPLVVALIQSADRLVQIRKNRMSMLQQDGESDAIRVCPPVPHAETNHACARTEYNFARREES